MQSPPLYPIQLPSSPFIDSSNGATSYATSSFSSHGQHPAQERYSVMSASSPPEQVGSWPSMSPTDATANHGARISPTSDNGLVGVSDARITRPPDPLGLGFAPQHEMMSSTHLASDPDAWFLHQHHHQQQQVYPGHYPPTPEQLGDTFTGLQYPISSHSRQSSNQPFAQAQGQTNAHFQAPYALSVPGSGPSQRSTPLYAQQQQQLPQAQMQFAPQGNYDSFPGFFPSSRYR